jgi:hypothetical protein
MSIRRATTLTTTRFDSRSRVRRPPGSVPQCVASTTTATGRAWSSSADTSRRSARSSRSRGPSSGRRRSAKSGIGRAPSFRRRTRWGRIDPDGLGFRHAGSGGTGGSVPGPRGPVKPGDRQAAARRSLGAEARLAAVEDSGTGPAGVRTGDLGRSGLPRLRAAVAAAPLLPDGNRRLRLSAQGLHGDVPSIFETLAAAKAWRLGRTTAHVFGAVARIAIGASMAALLMSNRGPAGGRLTPAVLLSPPPGKADGSRSGL